jgi:outer membrane lipoprotein-sorting protein
MSKLLLGTIVTSVLIGLASATQAQIPPGSSTPPKSTIPAQTQPKKVPGSTLPNSTIPPQTQPPNSAATTPDLALLSKAVGVFWQSDRIETDSQVLMNVESNGMNVNMSAQIKTIAQIGNKFQAQLTFAPLGSIPKSTCIITSNGRDVWIYRPDRRQYSKTTFAAFRSSSNWFWTGVSSSLFLSLTEVERKEIVSSLGTDRDFITATPASQFKDLLGSERQVDGQNLYTYSYDLKEQGLTFNVFVQPQAATVQRIEFNGKSDGIDIKFSEKIISRKPQVNIPKQTFEFVPPKGVKKVKFLDIDSFGK